MRIKLGNGLLLINLLVIALVAVIYLVPIDFIRIFLGLPFVLFFPGYVLILALFPKKESLGSIERTALSFGLSIAVVPLIGLALNYTKWGITVESTLYSISFFILLMSVIAWIRQKRLSVEERFEVKYESKSISSGKTSWDKALSIILVISILGAIGVLGYVIANPKVGEKFTEFYILGDGGQAANYPEEITLGDSASVIVGIINHEQGETTYRVEVRAFSEVIGQLGGITLTDEQAYEEDLIFAPSLAGEDQKVEFLLFKGGSAEPYLTLHLYINVVPN